MLRLLAYIHRRQGRTDETLREFGQAIDWTRAIFSTLQQTGFTYEGLRRYAEAVGFYNRALSILPSDVFTREELALVSYYERADLRPLHAAECRHSRQRTVGGVRQRLFPVVRRAGRA